MKAGPPAGAGELQEIRKKSARHLEKGPLAHDLRQHSARRPAAFFCEIIEMAKSSGVKILLDSDGEAMHACARSQADCDHAESAEAERLLGRALITRTQCLEAMEPSKAWGRNA